MMSHLKEQMHTYLQNHFDLVTAIQDLERARRRIKDLEDQQAALEPQITGSVSPICGSATKPGIRTYTNGHYRTLTVIWDDKIQRGRIRITENEK